MPRSRYGNISKVLMRQKAAAEPFNIPSLCGLDVVLCFETSDKIACYVAEGEVSLEGERIFEQLRGFHSPMIPRRQKALIDAIMHKKYVCIKSMCQGKPFATTVPCRMEWKIGQRQKQEAYNVESGSAMAIDFSTALICRSVSRVYSRLLAIPEINQDH
ncbi:predicted protein [Histoplasma capsulatum H143]|uniref:Uncharacterized protein n=1 Tax=Ajellomyces capsulatus (strain H143) TaxID=544712 RepID=C6HSQ5_AJECH|nr:predicted protein [Histoplasma capsulatum H143]